MMTIRLKDRRKPWQKACVNFKFALCGSVTQETARNFKRNPGRTGSTPFYTIGDLERTGRQPAEPLRYNPAPKPFAIAAE